MKEVRECPICDWKHEAERPQVPAGAPASVFGPGVMSAVAMQQHAWDIERALDAHFRTHSTVDWVKATVALRARVAELEAGAARYRWLRGKVCIIGTPHLSYQKAIFEFVNLPYPPRVAHDPSAELDAAIDAARLSGNKPAQQKGDV